MFFAFIGGTTAGSVAGVLLLALVRIVAAVAGERATHHVHMFVLEEAEDGAR
jgi:hypothetical protein